MTVLPPPAPGCRNMTSHPPATRSLSKAHKILGSLPLSVDAAPSNRDDASSSALSDDRSVTTATSNDPDSDPGDLFDDHPVGIAKSDNEWGDESGLLPHHLSINHHLVDRATGTITSTILRKSPSSSTITSWYDKSKLPLSISQQTSSSAMAKGLPIKPDRMLNVDIHTPSSRSAQPTTKAKKKPSRLDLSSLISGPRLIRKASQRHLGASGDLALASDCTVASPAIPPPAAAADSSASRRPLPGGRQPALPVSPAPRPDVTKDRCDSQWPRTSNALSALPTLYDHYEQMSMRHVMKQYSQSDMSHYRAAPRASVSPSKPEWQPAGRGSKCADWVRDSLPPTPETARGKSQREPSPAPATSPSVRPTRKMRAADKGFASADLQQTSVLVLSDSEGDDFVDDMSPSCKKTIAAPVTRPSALENDVPPLAPSRSRLPKHARDSDESRRSKTAKSSKRASLENALSATSKAKGGGSVWPSPTESVRGTTFLSSSANSLSAATDPSSRRASVASNLSGISTATELSKRSGYSIREARAVTMLPARRPLSRDRDDTDGASQQMLDWDESLHRMSIASSTDQPTPPLSPTSVDFYIRSAGSSVDTTGGHSRLMAVSRQEELLLSALRQKQRAMRGSALTYLREDKMDNEDWSDGRSAIATKAAHHGERRGFKYSPPSAASAMSAELTMIDLGLPGRRHSKQEAGHSFERRSANESFRRRWSAAVAESDSKRSSQASGCCQEVPFLLDDADPSPDLSDYRDWHAAMTSGTTQAGKPSSRRDLFSQSRRQRRGSGQSGSECSPTQTPVDRRGRLSGVAEEAELDVPRPDSPISPESFPAVPAAGCNPVRLSAVGPGSARDATHP